MAVRAMAMAKKRARMKAARGIITVMKRARARVARVIAMATKRARTKKRGRQRRQEGWGWQQRGQGQGWREVWQWQLGWRATNRAMVRAARVMAIVIKRVMPTVTNCQGSKRDGNGD